MIAGIETGGTKVICGAVSEDQPHRLLRSTRIATTTPDETTSAVNAFLAVEFALEAKCYAPGHGVGARETSRLFLTGRPRMPFTGTADRRADHPAPFTGRGADVLSLAVPGVILATQAMKLGGVLVDRVATVPVQGRVDVVAQTRGDSGEVAGDGV